LTGRVALITGASRGIGAAIAERLSQAGAELVLAARGQPALEALAGQLAQPGMPVHCLPLDVGDRESIQRLGPALAERLGGRPLDILVNNAGIAHSAPVERSAGGTAGDLFDLHLAVNFHGPRRLVQLLLSSLLASRGVVVNVASSAALRGYPYVTAYCASKHALLGYSRALALELAPKGLRVQVVCPHYVDSPLLEQSIRTVMQKTGQSEAQARGFFAQQNPSGRLIPAAEVAAAVLELCLAPQSGHVLELDGSQTLERGELLWPAPAAQPKATPGKQ
jgi:NAD(P)-dependent dehydrogenase (short-subunit alcohol dehydrogenase family)